jgi:hypothetical protein
MAADAPSPLLDPLREVALNQLAIQGTLTADLNTQAVGITAVDVALGGVLVSEHFKPAAIVILALSAVAAISALARSSDKGFGATLPTPAERGVALEAIEEGKESGGKAPGDALRKMLLDELNAAIAANKTALDRKGPSITVGIFFLVVGAVLIAAIGK